MHYCAIARILEQDTAILVNFDITQFSVFQWTLLDSLLYHFSTRLIFEESIHAVCSSFPYRVIAKYIHAIDNERSRPSSLLVLPVLGRIPPALFLQIYLLTWLSRQRPLGSGPHHELALQCLAEIKRLENEYETARPESCSIAQDGHETNSTIGAKLYFLAAQIFARKLESPEQTHSTSTKICHLLSKSLRLLKDYDGDAFFGQFICWPVLIFGCAASPSSESDSTQDRSFSREELLHTDLRAIIQRQLLHIWGASHSGHVKRTADTLERIWKASRCSPENSIIGSHSAENHDGLDALIWPNGITRFRSS